MFFTWIAAQTQRTDDVGEFARHVVKDKIFPRYTSHLYLILLRYEGLPRLRGLAKRAHTEFRRARRALKVAS